MNIARTTCFYAVAAMLLFAASATAQSFATGDTRNVTEPVFPAVCQVVSATITEVNNSILAGVDSLDVPTSVDATNTNPDGARIQAALNACANTGNAVELSMDSTGAHNAFVSGPLVMKADETLLVDPGVTLFFSRNARDFDPVQGTHTCGTVNNGKANASCLALIDIPAAATNVGIMGYGRIDARGGDPLLNGFMTTGYAAPSSYTWWNLAAQANVDSGGSQQNPESLIQPENNASGITLYKITLLNPSMFHVKSIGNVSDLTAWDIKIVTPTYTRNTDGIDPDQATNVTVNGSWISDGDDNIAVGASNSKGLCCANEAANISIINNHFFAGHGESIGSFTSGTVTNVLFDNNMSAGDDFAGKGSAINSTPFTITTTTYPANYADGNSTAIRVKSDQAAGGPTYDIQYSNSCFLDHKSDLLFTPLYSTSAGSLTPDVYNIYLYNLAFLNDAGKAGTVQFTGTNTVVSGITYTYPLGITLSNVTFPAALSSSSFTVSSTSGKEQYTNMTYGPGDVSSNFITDYASFASVGSNFDTVTNNITASSLNPPNCNFTYIAPELTGPKGLPQTISTGQTATAVVILTPAVGGAAWPTGTVTLTDEFTGKQTEVSLPGNNDTIFVSLTGLAPGVHNFYAAYAGDSNYKPSVPGQPYTTAGPYEITVVQPPTVTLTSTETVSGSHASGYSMTVTVTNSGTAPASNVMLTAATLGSTSGTPLPQSGGTIAAGGTATFTVAFPGSAGLDGAGAAVKVSGTYTGGTFSGSIRSLTLP